MPPKKDNFICREHSSVITRLEHLEVDVKGHRSELDEGQQKFADFSGDMKVIKVLLAFVLCAVLGGAFGPKVWALIGF